MIWPIIAEKPLLARHVRLCSRASQRGRRANQLPDGRQPFPYRIMEEFPVILPQSEASSKLRFRSRQVIEKMVTLTSSSWNQIVRWLRQLDAVRFAAWTPS